MQNASFELTKEEEVKDDAPMADEEAEPHQEKERPTQPVPSMLV